MKLFEIPIYYRTREDSNKNHYWRCCDYNEVIGWVVLYSRKSAIRAEYWFVSQRPTKILIRKEFENMGKLFQVSVNNLNNAQIFNRLVEAFKDFQSNGNLSKFHFDIEALINIGKHLDWNVILNKTSA